MVWIISLVGYFTEAYVDYHFKLQIWITTVPILITFIIITVVIDNLIVIYLQLVQPIHRMPLLQVAVFRPIAFVCVLSQVVNPVLAQFETYN